jgi:cysteinyl-tRNA synthetase
MSSRYLGKFFDIHGGGQDLIFPHHENELAQSRCAYDTPVLARYWMHNGYLTVQGDKMSKSAGNFFTVRDLLAHYPGEVIRFALLSTHYRQPMDWTESVLQQARHGLDRLYTALRGCGGMKGEVGNEASVMEALKDDLNTPLAISRLHDLATTLNKTADETERSRKGDALKAGGRLMGLLQQDPEAWFQDSVIAGGASSEIQAQIQARRQARDRKDFAESDRIRDALRHQGIVLEDGSDGTTWRRV